MDNKDKEVAYKAIAQARKELDRGDYSSIHLANYVLRDLKVTEEAGLSDLSWAMHRNNLHRNDVLGLIAHLERYMKDYEDTRQD